MQRVVVVGAGLAGAQTCVALRDQGYAGSLTLLGAERHLPYDRPPLTKELLRGDVDDTALDVDWAALDVELLLGVRATGLGANALATDAGDLPWDALVLATGSTPRRLPGDGPQLTLRTVDDARRLRDTLQPGAAIVLVGAGWIGAEVATEAAARGCAVTVVEAGPAPLAQALGAEIGRCTEAWYAEAGVTLRIGVGVREVVAAGVLLASGELLPADLVVTGVGVVPTVDWLTGSGVALGDGVLVDERCRTSMSGVLAVGDCAERWSPRFGTRLRLEHWDEALHAPAVAAATLLGGDAVHDPVPYFWSDQFGRTLQYVGHRGSATELVWRGDPAADRAWSACWVENGILVAAVAVDRPRDALQARRLVGSAVDVERLADASAPLKSAAMARFPA